MASAASVAFTAIGTTFGWTGRGVPAVITPAAETVLPATGAGRLQVSATPRGAVRTDAVDVEVPSAVSSLGANAIRANRVGPGARCTVQPT